MEAVLLRPPATALPLEQTEVLRLLGYRPGVTQLNHRHEALVDRGIALTLEAAAPAASTRYCGIDITGDTVTTRVPGLQWRSRALARLLRDAVGVTLVAATLGPGPEELVARLFKQEEYALATIVDAAGSALIHALSRHIQSSKAEHTPLYGPGYGDWPIQDQIALTQAAGGPGIGLTCSPTCYLTPQKSLVGLLGLVPASAAVRLQGGCSMCSLRDCAYRMERKATP